MTRPIECWSCGARSGLGPAAPVWDGGWPVAKCVDDEACRARRDKRIDRARQRGSVIHVFPRPCADPPADACQWCGEPIVLVDPSDHRRRRRAMHYGDAHEVGDRKCRSEANRSCAWSGRDAIKQHAQHLDVATLACVDCGTVVDEFRGGYWHGIPGQPWEADHELALEDGGRHEMENLRCRCVPCHRSKTAREATARAVRRRAIAEAQAMVDAGQVSLLEATFVVDALAAEGDNVTR